MLPEVPNTSGEPQISRTSCRKALFNGKQQGAKDQ